MPHIKLEYTENIDASLTKPIFKELRNILIENAAVKDENCKCKAIWMSVNAVGRDGDLRHFYHLEISLLQGRSKEVRQKIGQQSLASLKEYFADNSGKIKKQFSVEIREIKPGNYFTSTVL